MHTAERWHKDNARVLYDRRMYFIVVQLLNMKFPSSKSFFFNITEQLWLCDRSRMSWVFRFWWFEIQSVPFNCIKDKCIQYQFFSVKPPNGIVSSSGCSVRATSRKKSYTTQMSTSSSNLSLYLWKHTISSYIFLTILDDEASLKRFVGNTEKSAFRLENRNPSPIWEKSWFLNAKFDSSVKCLIYFGRKSSPNGWIHLRL